MYNAGPQQVIKDHLPVFEPIFKVRIGRPWRKRIRDFRKSEVVRGDESDGSLFHQAADDRLRSDRPVMRIGSVKNLIQQQQHRKWFLREFHDVAQSLYFRIETRCTAEQRILYAQSGADGRGDSFMRSALTGLRKCEGNVRSYGSKKRALAGHVEPLMTSIEDRRQA